MPKRLICVGPEQLEWQSYTEPALAGDQVRIQVEHAAAKHGTEMAFFTGYGLARGTYDPAYQVFRHDPPANPYPMRLGNMLVGTVVERGPQAHRLTLGARVCLYGGFAETAVASETRCWPMPAEMPWQTAVCLDPADFAVGAVRDGHVRLGDAVAVFGMGAIGLVVVQVLRLAGARPIIAIEPLAPRRALARACGADLVLDPTACDAGLEIKLATGGRGADVCIEYSGARAALQAALRGVAYGGRVVMGAFPAPYGAGLDLGGEAHHNIPTIVFSRACSQPDRDHPRWDENRIFALCWELLKEGRISGEAIVQPIVPFDDLLTEYPRIASHPEDHIKLGVRVG
jgi:threonine dehydrogenase-like Zn-dependent dehydrogenase